MMAWMPEIMTSVALKVDYVFCKSSAARNLWRSCEDRAELTRISPVLTCYFAVRKHLHLLVARVCERFPATPPVFSPVIFKSRIGRGLWVCPKRTSHVTLLERLNGLEKL